MLLHDARLERFAFVGVLSLAAAHATHWAVLQAVDRLDAAGWAPAAAFAAAGVLPRAALGCALVAAALAASIAARLGRRLLPDGQRACGPARSPRALGWDGERWLATPAGSEGAAEVGVARPRIVLDVGGRLVLTWLEGEEGCRTPARTRGWGIAARASRTRRWGIAARASRTRRWGVAARSDDPQAFQALRVALHAPQRRPGPAPQPR